MTGKTLGQLKKENFNFCSGVRKFGVDDSIVKMTTLFHKRNVLIITHVMELGNYVLGLKFRQSQPQNILVWELSSRMFWFLWFRLPHHPGYTLLPAMLI